MSCPACGEYFNDFDREPKYCKDLDITVCELCVAAIEKMHKITGRFEVHKCKECKHITKVEFIKYKKRGRSPGSKNTPKPPEGIKTLEEWIK
jgi:hypothetical protein